MEPTPITTWLKEGEAQTQKTMKSNYKWKRSSENRNKWGQAVCIINFSVEVSLKFCFIKTKWKRVLSWGNIPSVIKQNALFGALFGRETKGKIHKTATQWYSNSTIKLFCQDIRDSGSRSQGIWIHITHHPGAFQNNNSVWVFWSGIISVPHVDAIPF